MAALNVNDLEFDSFFEEHSTTLAVSLEKAIQSAYRDYLCYQQSGQRGELTHIYISLLLSSVLCKLPWMRIDLCDEISLATNIECSVEWGVTSVSDKLYHDADVLAKNLDRIKDYEIEQLWLNAIDKYVDAFERFLPHIIDLCAITQSVNCSWHFGLYLSKYTILRERLNDEIL